MINKIERFQINLDADPTTGESFYKVIQLSNETCTIYYGNKNESLLLFFQDKVPTI